jgi:hypothetical protein
LPDAHCIVGADLHREGRQRRLLHRDFHHQALAGAIALAQRREDSRAQMSRAQHVHHHHTGLQRRTVGFSRNRHDSALRLYDRIEGRQVAVGPGLSIAAAAGVDQARIDLL